MKARLEEASRVEDFNKQDKNALNKRDQVTQEYNKYTIDVSEKFMDMLTDMARTYRSNLMISKPLLHFEVHPVLILPSLVAILISLGATVVSILVQRFAFSVEIFRSSQRCLRLERLTHQTTAQARHQE